MKVFCHAFQWAAERFSNLSPWGAAVGRWHGDAALSGRVVRLFRWALTTSSSNIYIYTREPIFENCKLELRRYNFPLVEFHHYLWSLLFHRVDWQRHLTWTEVGGDRHFLWPPPLRNHSNTNLTGPMIHKVTRRTNGDLDLTDAILADSSQNTSPPPVVYISTGDQFIHRAPGGSR